MEKYPCYISTVSFQFDLHSKAYTVAKGGKFSEELISSEEINEEKSYSYRDEDGLHREHQTLTKKDVFKCTPILDESITNFYYWGNGSYKEITKDQFIDMMAHNSVRKS